MYKVANQIVRWGSLALFFIFLFAQIAVGAAGHSSSESDQCVLLYFIALFFSLKEKGAETFSWKGRKIFAIIFLFLGVCGVIYQFFEIFNESHGSDAFIFAGVLVIILILLMMVLIGRLKGQFKAEKRN